MADTATLTFLGAAGTVTGSKFLLQAGSNRVLVDAGLLHREKRGKWVHFSVDVLALRDLGEQLAGPRGALAPA